jgi:hypothetical protein
MNLRQKQIIGGIFAALLFIGALLLGAHLRCTFAVVASLGIGASFATTFNDKRVGAIVGCLCGFLIIFGLSTTLVIITIAATAIFPHLWRRRTSKASAETVNTVKAPSASTSTSMKTKIKRKSTTALDSVDD